MNPSSDDLDIIRSEAGLAADVRAMIEQTREAVARTVNAGMPCSTGEWAGGFRWKSLRISGRITEGRLSLRCRDN